MAEKTGSKIRKLSNLQEMPKRPKHLQGATRKEWDRVAPRLFSMGRLQRQEGLCLEMYCSNYGLFAKFAEGLSRGKPTDQEEMKVRTKDVKKLRKMCADAALMFGFRLDSTGRMNLEKPMSLTTADKILTARKR